MGVATDLVVAAALCYFLRKFKTGFKSSNSLVARLMMYAINTGIVTRSVSVTLAKSKLTSAGWPLQCYQRGNLGSGERVST